MRLRRWPAAGVLGAALAVAGCDGPARPSSTAAATVTVLAAASLTEAFTDLRSVVATDPAVPTIVFSFAGSQQLAAQLEAGAPADVIATADPVSMARLTGAGLVDPPTIFAANRLAVAVEPGNPRRVRTLADLGRPDLRVVLADPSVPAGRYGREILDRAGVTVRPASLELDVRSVAAKVVSGEADAGIVYATDVPAAARVEIPDDANVAVTYPVAVVRGTVHRAAAQAFVDRLLGPAGRQAMAGRGFRAP